MFKLIGLYDKILKTGRTLFFRKELIKKAYYEQSLIGTETYTQPLLNDTLLQLIQL